MRAQASSSSACEVFLDEQLIDHSLVPADRFYGRWPEVRAEMDSVSRRRPGALALKFDRRLFIESPAAGERAITLQLVVVGDQAELHLFGRRIVLGRFEP